MQKSIRHGLIVASSKQTLQSVIDKSMASDRGLVISPFLQQSPGRVSIRKASCFKGGAHKLVKGLKQQIRSSF